MCKNQSAHLKSDVPYPDSLAAGKQQQRLEKALSSIKRLDRNARRSKSRFKRLLFLERLYDQSTVWANKFKACNRLMEHLKPDALPPFDISDVAAAVLSTLALIDRKAKYKYLAVVRWAAMRNIGPKKLAERIAKQGGINRCVDRYRAKTKNGRSP